MTIFGCLEFLIIFILAFVIIGPRDFPKVMYKVGDAWRRLRFMGEQMYQKWETFSEQSYGDSHDKKDMGEG